jgi:hypothetical protein
MRLEMLIEAAKANAEEQGLPPVEKWHPENCANMQMKILKNGTWLHDGKPILRASLVELFSTILRKDEDGQTWLVTPVEKVLVEVEAAPFLAISVDRSEGTAGPDLFFTTNVGAVVRADEQHKLWVETDQISDEPSPFLRVRGRLDALLTRPAFYQLVEWATEKNQRLGVQSHGQFFPLGPKHIHVIT